MAIQDGDKNPQTQVTSNAYEHVLTELDSVNFALKGDADSQAEVRADGGDDAEVGTLYVSSAGKTWQKVADNKVNADWTLFTGANAFDQDLNTSDSVEFVNETLTGYGSATWYETVQGSSNGFWITPAAGDYSEFVTLTREDLGTNEYGFVLYAEDASNVFRGQIGSNSCGLRMNFSNTNDVVAGGNWTFGSSVNLQLNQVYKVNSVQVVGAQGAAVADATGAGDVVAQLNTLLARLRAHGLIAT